MEGLLREIYGVVSRRKADLPDGSYTASLFKEGKKQVLRKFLEEASEVVISSGFEDHDALVHELADLWFHTIVLMVLEGVTIDEVLEELNNRRR